MKQVIKVVGRFDRFDELREFVLDFVARMDGEYPEEMKLGQLGFQTRVGCGDRFHCCNWIKEGVKETDYSELLPELRGTVPHTGWCSEVGYILEASQGAHLVTRDEIQRDALTKVVDTCSDHAIMRT